VVAKAAIVLAALTGLAAAVVSLRWQMAVDAPLLAYSALAIDQFGAVPYRDIFDFNAPGAYLANIAIGRIFGYSESGFRLADLACLSLIMAATLTALRRHGWQVAWTAALSFGFIYLGYGPDMSLQREYLLLVPLSWAIALALADSMTLRHAAAIGALLGVAVSIKPQSAIVWPAFAFWLYREGGRRRHQAGLVTVMTTATVLPVAVALTWVWSAGGLDAFTDIASRYWPLYAELTSARPHAVVSGADLWAYRLNRFVISRDLRHLILIPAIVGAWLAARSPADATTRSTALLLSMVAGALQLYPLAAGKYWGYHWLPSIYGASLLASLCFVRFAPAARVPRDLAASMAVVMITAQAPGLQTLWKESRIALADARVSTATQIAGELRLRLTAGDRIQPLDWTGGVVHALFLTKTRLATPFLYDFYFYHHVSSPYIQSLRGRFLRELAAARPAFIVSGDQQRRFEGAETTDQFSELSEWLSEHYRAVVTTDRFVIYARTDRAD
jgi:hypothetical protein